jgi:hypothetical protein
MDLGYKGKRCLVTASTVSPEWGQIMTLNLMSRSYSLA